MTRNKVLLVFAWSLLAIGLALPDSYSLPDYHENELRITTGLFDYIRFIGTSLWDIFDCTPTPSPSTSTPPTTTPTTPTTTTTTTTTTTKTPCNCGFTSRQTLRVIGGPAATSANEFPWQVLINPSGTTSMRCSGALIHPSWVLTSASCMGSATIALVKAGIISHTDNSTGSFQYTTGIINRHPSFVTSSSTAVYKDNDIALVQLSSPLLVNNSAVQPICLPVSEANTSFVSKTVNIAGWGVNDDSNTVLHSVSSIPVLDDSVNTCPVVTFTDKTMCLGTTSSKGPCIRGDSGSPVTWMDTAYTRAKLVGIVGESVISCYDLETPVIRVARVASYLNWIYATTSEFSFEETKLNCIYL